MMCARARFERHALCGRACAYQAEIRVPGGAMNIRMKKLSQYVAPTILGNCAYFLFTIIEGTF